MHIRSCIVFCLCLVAWVVGSKELLGDEPTLSEIRNPKEVTFPPVPDSALTSYTARFVTTPIDIDGKLNESSWDAVEQSRSFVDLVSGKTTMHKTTVKLLWDLEYLYVGYQIEEPNIKAKFTERDSPIWQENDVEMFIALDHTYYEFEINALGTIYEGLFIWKESYEDLAFDQFSEVNVSSNQVKHQPFNGVGYTKHPRGKRIAFLAWDYPGLKSAVHLNGTLNQEDDTDAGWTVELAIPWKGLKVPAHGDKRSIPPRHGDLWRMDFSRFNQSRAPSPARDSGGWALNHHGVWDSHIPEVFSKIYFSKEVVYSK